MIIKEENINLKNFNTFNIDFFCKTLYIINEKDDIKVVFDEIKNKNEQYYILGSGSNTLFSGEFNGNIVMNKLKGINIINENESSILISCNSGENWHNFVEFTINNNYFGLENLALIPGTVGAAPIQNIGAYGIEVKEFIQSIEYYNIENDEFSIINNIDCEFDYRNSIFKNKMKNKIFISNVTFKLNKTPKLNINYGNIVDVLNNKKIINPSPKDVFNAVIDIRKSKLPDPKEIGNAGSFFKNPYISIEQFNSLKLKFTDMPFYEINDVLYKIPAAWLIEKTAWKGKTINNKYGVHKNQALVLVNYSNATGNEIYELSENIIEDVYELFGIKLEREVNYI